MDCPICSKELKKLTSQNYRKHRCDNGHFFKEDINSDGCFLEEIDPNDETLRIGERHKITCKNINEDC